MKRENPSSAKIIFLAPVCLPASRHCYNSLKFQSLSNKHQEIQNWNKKEKYQATQILTCPNVQIFSVCSTTFFSQVEQCRLFNSLISCRQVTIKKNCHAGRISFNNFISCCRQDIFWQLYILQARNLFMSSWRLLIYNFWEDNEGFVDQSLGG